MQQGPARNPPGTPFIELQSVDSTNNYARQLLHAGMTPHGTTIFAWEQTAGKGQRGKSWTAETGKNIMLSVILDPSPMPVTRQFEWSAATALATWDFFSKYAGDSTTLKWPNDLYWQDRKAGGILIESVVSSSESGVDSRESEVGSRESRVESRESGASLPVGRSGVNSHWKWSIVGMGININQTSFSPELPNPVSLKQITGKEFDVIRLAEELCVFLDKRINQLHSVSPGAIISEYNSCLYKRNEIVKLKKDNRVFEARICEVTSDGKLVVEHDIMEYFSFGEIEWKIE